MDADTSSASDKNVPTACGSNLLRHSLAPRERGDVPRGCGGQSHGTEPQRASCNVVAAPISTNSIPLSQCCPHTAILWREFFPAIEYEPKESARRTFRFRLQTFCLRLFPVSPARLVRTIVVNPTKYFGGTHCNSVSTSCLKFDGGAKFR
jgi:hypothetical protein